MDVLPWWLRGGDAVEPLCTVSNMKRARNENKDNTHVLQQLIREELIENNHCVVVTMRPDARYHDHLAAAEEEMVQATSSALTAAQRQQIDEDAAALAAAQNAEQDVSVLPTLHVSDIARNILRHDVSCGRLVEEGPALWSVNTPCNGITYVRMRVALSSFPSHLIPWLPLFSFLATRVGNAEMDYRQLSQKLKMTTGGVRIGSDLVFSSETFGKANVELTLTVSALDRLAPAAVDTLFSILRSPRLTDRARVKTLISQRLLSVSQSLQEGAGSYARSAAVQALSSAHALSEGMGGLTQVGHSMQQLPNDDASEASLDNVISHLQHIATIISAHFSSHFSLQGGSGSRVCVSAQRSGVDPDLARALRSNLVDAPHAALDTAGHSDPLTSFSQKALSAPLYLSLPTQVNSVMRVHATAPYAHPSAPSLLVASRLMSSTCVRSSVLLHIPPRFYHSPWLLSDSSTNTFVRSAARACPHAATFRFIHMLCPAFVFSRHHNVCTRAGTAAAHRGALMGHFLSLRASKSIFFFVQIFTAWSAIGTQTAARPPMCSKHVLNGRRMRVSQTKTWPKYEIRLRIFPPV
jgi:presequence protease